MTGPLVAGPDLCAAGRSRSSNGACARVVFNDCVRAREEARRAGGPFLKAGELSARLITEAKRTA
ncbi:hypothetical protein ABZT00_13280, partial [Streptomyces sp. NPDC005486]